MTSKTTPIDRSAQVRRTLRWQERAVEWLNGDLGRFLDFGCGPCGLIERLQDRCDECHGVDVDGDKIAASKLRFPSYKLGLVGPDSRTDYPDN